MLDSHARAVEGYEHILNAPFPKPEILRYIIRSRYEFVFDPYGNSHG
ncbi:hypothetical protein [Alkalinema sp. FACHB-956]|nr:hypothetical protein [Alkalinema sp. FACHB-956]MBD2326297.1 hypothetical protein [Alkalinema sp. FACHB-956]